MERVLDIFFKSYRWKGPGEIIFGIDSISKLPDIIKYYNGSKGLLITDEGLIKSGNIEKILNVIRELNGFEVDVYKDVEPEPSLSTAENVAEYSRRGYDVIIGVGGGSVLDIAKLASLMAANPGRVRDYLGMYKIKKRGTPKILVPTTAGTGSEVSEAIVLTDPDSDTKLVIYSEYAPGDTIILDPRLTVSLPPHLTASTGMDALSHAIESYMSIDSTPFSEAFSEKAIELIGRYVRRAYYNGSDLEARYNMLIASTLASMSWVQSSLCQGHAIGLAIGVKYHIPHGISVALSLPYVMWFNRAVIPYRIARVGYLLGVEGELDEWEASSKAVEYIFNLLKDLNLPSRLSDIDGASEEHIDELAEAASKAERLLIHSPRRTTKDDLVEIITWMFKGSLE